MKLPSLAIFEGSRTIGKSRTFWSGFIILLIFTLIYPLIVGSYTVFQTTVYFVWVILALSLTLIWGYTGIFSFGQTAFFGLGGYLFGIIAGNLIEITGTTNIAFVSGIVGPAIFAAIIGYFLFYGRVSGVYVAIITLCITLVLELIFRSTGNFSIGEVTLGGYNGLNRVEELTFGIGEASFSLGPIAQYYFVVLILLSLYLGLRYILNSNFGYVLVAIREDEERTEMLGYDVRKIKMKVFTISGAIAGLAGVLFVSWGSFINPTVMGLTTAALPVIWITIGGRETLIGSIIAAFGLQYVDTSLSSISNEYSILVLGLILVVSILVFPRGIVPKIMENIDKGEKNAKN